MHETENRFKQGLLGGSAPLGLWLGLADAYSAEVCASAGFDWLLIDAEHSPNDVRSILSQLQALAAYPVAPVVRPSCGEPAVIKQMLDIGAQTLLIPMVESAEQAAALVRAMRYPPGGIRGVGSALARASRWNGIGDYLQRADARMCLIVQIESGEGLRHLEAIAAVDGVDGLFIGPADLAASLGHRGNPGHPQVQQAIDDAIRRIVGSGKAAGILSADEALARHYLRLGCRFIALGADVGLLLGACRALLGRFSAADT